jgi:alpha-L-fucosidase
VAISIFSTRISVKKLRNSIFIDELAFGTYSFFIQVCAMRTFYIGLFSLALLLHSCSPAGTKEQSVVPSARQLNWQDLEYYAFVHFSINTFTDKEWGFGDESPELFNPTELDTDQWARVAKEAGMKGIIITAKHHDGFALWPSVYTEHSVKNSPWRDGKGDLLKELRTSCDKYGLKMGVYLSPWDRNHPDYGTEAYITYYRNQLTELLTQYGPLFEVWFDGANGGDGYYGGANESRKVDKLTYYDWPNAHALVRQYQPDAVMFSDAGPDIRWVGNEKGYANQTTWSTLYRDSVYAGMPDFDRFSAGQEEGTHWVPTETDVSIRPGWFYHASEDDKVKTVAHLWDIYLNSVGLNSNLLLNLPVDRRGLVHETDVERLMGLKTQLDATFAQNLIASAAPSELSDGDRNTFELLQSGESHRIEIELTTPVEANLFSVQEAIQFGQHIQSFRFFVADESGNYKNVYEGTTVGNKRMITFDTQNVTGVAFEVIEAKATVRIAEVALHRAPDLE